MLEGVDNSIIGLKIILVLEKVGGGGDEWGFIFIVRRIKF